MALQGIEKKHEIKRTRILRDTRPLTEQVLESLATLPAIIIVYVCLVFCLFFIPASFELVLIVGVGYFFIPLSRKPDIPLRKRMSLHEIDDNDIDPATRKKQMSRGIAMLANRASDNAEVWADAGLLKTHIFEAGSTGAGKTEGLISLAENALIWVSGYFYSDGKGDVSCFAKHFSMCRGRGREDDIFVINYMTGNSDTTKKRSDKLSNSYNPLMVGNAETNIQLIVGLMDAGDGKGDMWKGRAISYISSYMPALCELRDASLLVLYIGVVREYMPYPKYFELMNNPNISPRSRDMMQAYLADVPGYKRDKGENQSATFLEQYGYQQMQFTRILSSLADTYGHIFNTPQGEVNLKDIVVNRRILLVLLPALEKSRPELGNLGKIIVAGMKGMMGANLGSKLEGTKLELLDSRATNAPTPFIAIFDELGYYMPEDAALMWAQARSLGFSLVASGQDLQAFYRTSKEETLAIVSNSNIKIFGKMEDPTDTFDLIKRLAGQAFVSVVDGYETDTSSVLGGYQSGPGARIEEVDRITLQDLQRQIEGEVHIMVKGEVIRARAYYAAPKLAKEYRLNHFLKVKAPDPDSLKKLKINTRELLASLQTYPFAKVRPKDGYFAYVGQVLEDKKYQHYVAAKLGVERGICLLLKYDDNAVLPPIEKSGNAAQEGGGGSVALAQTPPALASASPETPTPQGTALLAAQNAAPDVPTLAAAPSALAQGPAAAPTAALAAAPDLTFDGGKLEAVSVFQETPKQEVSLDILSLTAAAIPIIETALESKLDLPQATGETQAGGLLDEKETAVLLSKIVTALGGTPSEAVEASKAVIQAATQGTEYPVPPKPEKDGKDDDMEDVLNNLESLIRRQ